MKNLLYRPSYKRSIELRQELVEFFQGDHCAAMICALLEEKTAAYESLHPSDEPWIPFSNAFIKSSMMGLFRSNRINACLKELQSRWIIDVKMVNGIRMVNFNQYLVDNHLSRREDVTYLGWRDCGK